MTLPTQNDTIKEIRTLFDQLDNYGQEDVIVHLIEHLRGFDPENRIAKACLVYTTTTYLNPTE
jgi:hypothetical protein